MLAVDDRQPVVPQGAFGRQHAIDMGKKIAATRGLPAQIGESAILKGHQHKALFTIIMAVQGALQLVRGGKMDEAVARIILGPGIVAGGFGQGPVRGGANLENESL